MKLIKKILFIILLVNLCMCVNVFGVKYPVYPKDQGPLEIDNSIACVYQKGEVIVFNYLTSAEITSQKISLSMESEYFWLYPHPQKDHIYLASFESSTVNEMNWKTGELENLFVRTQRTYLHDRLLFSDNLLFDFIPLNKIIVRDIFSKNVIKELNFQRRSIYQIMQFNDQSSLWLLSCPYDWERVTLSEINLTNWSEETVVTLPSESFPREVIFHDNSVYIPIKYESIPQSDYYLNRIYSFDLISRKITWVSNLFHESFYKPALTKNNLVTYACDSNLYAFDLKTGKLNWKYRLPGKCFINPVSTEKYIYAVPYKVPTIFVFDERGEVVSTITLEDRATSQLSLIHNILLVIDSNGKIYAINTDTNKLIWKKNFLQSN